MLLFITRSHHDCKQILDWLRQLSHRHTTPNCRLSVSPPNVLRGRSLSLPAITSSFASGQTNKPASSPLKLGSWISCFTYIQTPRVSTLQVSAATHPYMQDSETPSVGVVSQALDHRVSCDALTPALSVSWVITCDAAS